MLRKIIWTLHLWIGLTLGLLAAVSGLSGSAMVFGPDLESWLHPHQWQSKLLVKDTTPVGIQSVADSLKQQHPEAELLFIRFPQKPNGVYEAWLDGGELRATIDQYSGQILSTYGATDSVFGWLYVFHTEYLQGERGEMLVGWAGLGLLFLSVSGVVVWWPRKGDWRAAFSYRSRTARRPGYNLHRFVGWISALMLSVIALSGASLVYPEVSTRVLESALGSSPQEKPKSKFVDSEMVSFDKAVETAKQTLPGARVTRISPPAKKDAPLVVRVRFPEETHPFGQSNVYLDAYSGKVLRADDARRVAQSQQLLNLRYPLHIGQWGGRVSQILHCIAGVVPAILYVTGIMMWWSRRRTRLAAEKARAARRNSPATVPAT
jgi:uncharacterized iron-regulated membrane protein